MRNVGGTSKYIAFVDECGDHSLEKIDNDFPMFALCTLVMERQVYAEQVIPAMGRFKLKYWTHEGVNLHSRDIRKANGPYGFLKDATLRGQFMPELSALMQTLPYTVFICAIRKHDHKSRYGENATNPYELALEYTMERVCHFLRCKKEFELPFVAEARGKNEDESLERVFYRILSNGTSQMASTRFKKLVCPLVFRRKYDNIAGIQLADLCAHPCARHILKPTQANQAYDIVKKKIYGGDGVSGWKIFP